MTAVLAPVEELAAGQHWEIGSCWLYCERDHVPVMWLGAAQWLGQHAPIYACEPCVRRLHAKVRLHLTCRDNPKGTP